MIITILILKWMVYNDFCFLYRIYIYNKVKVVKNLEEMLNTYNVAVNEKDAKLKILRELMKEYKQEKERVFKDIKSASAAATRIEEIALGKSLLTSISYIERLIESERCSNRPNKTNRFWTNSFQINAAATKLISKSHQEQPNMLQFNSNHIY